MPERVHGAEGVRGVRTEQDLAQAIPEERPFGHVDREHRKSLGDPVLCILAEFVTVGGHHGKDAQDVVGIVDGARFVEIDAVLLEEKVSACDGRATPAELTVKGLARRRQVFKQQVCAAKDGARMPIVGAHPVRRVGGAPRLEADALCGCFILGMPVQRVVIAAATEVQKTSGRSHEVKGGIRVILRGGEGIQSVFRPDLGLLQRGEQREPMCQLIVTQSAGTLLDVGLEVKDGVAVLGVTGPGNFGEFLGNGAPLAQKQGRQNVALQAAEQQIVPMEEAAIHERNGELQVVRIEAVALLEDASGCTRAKADVPHGLVGHADPITKLMFDIVVRAEIQQVDVRIRKEVAPAVPTGTRRWSGPGVPGCR